MTGFSDSAILTEGVCMRSAPTRSESTFHCIKSKYANSSVAKGLANGTLTLCDADRIQEFVTECQSCNNISASRPTKLVCTLVGWRRLQSAHTSRTA